jgi:hypothetical protein
MAMLRKEVEDYRPGLVAADPLEAFIPGNADTFRGNAVWSILKPVATLAQQNDLAFVILHHNRKASGGKAMLQASGSVQIVGTARAGVSFFIDREDEDATVMTHSKANLSPIGKGPSRAFTVKDGKLVWLGERDVTADEMAMLAMEPRKSRKAEAVEFLEAFGRNGGIELASDVEAAADAYRIKGGSLKAAKKDLGIKSEKIGEVWYWIWPGALAEQLGLAA